MNGVKALADHLVCLEEPMRNENVVMSLLMNLLPSYDYLITTLETMPMPMPIKEFDCEVPEDSFDARAQGGHSIIKMSNHV